MKDILDKIDLIQKHVDELRNLIAARPSAPTPLALVAEGLRAEMESIQRAEAAHSLDGPNSAVDVHNGNHEMLKVLDSIIPEASPPPSGSHAVPAPPPAKKEAAQPAIGMLHGAPAGFDNAQPAESVSIWGGGKR